MSTWIPISERLPTREETNGHDTVWAVDERGTHWIWDYVMSPISRFAHPPIAWHAFPRYMPPKPRKWDAWDAADGSVRWSIWTSDAYSKPFQVVELTPAVRAALEKEGLLP